MTERKPLPADFELLAATFGLPAAELGTALASQQVFSYAPGDPIIREGEHGTNVYVVLKGNVSVRRSRWVLLSAVARLGPGDIFGEKAFLGSATRSASVESDGSCEVFCIGAAPFKALLERHPDLHAKVRELARQRLSQLLH